MKSLNFRVSHGADSLRKLGTKSGASLSKAVVKIGTSQFTLELTYPCDIRLLLIVGLYVVVKFLHINIIEDTDLRGSRPDWNVTG